MRLDIRESPVRKTGRFTHVSSLFGHDVRGKRFNTHVSSKFEWSCAWKTFYLAREEELGR